MRRRVPLFFLLFLLGLASACRSAGGHLPPTLVWPEPERRVEAWREDLAHLARELVDRHAAPFRVLPEAEFQRAVRRLYDGIPALDDQAVVIELARLAASLGDGHTGFFLHGPRLGLRPNGLWLMSFDDGVFVKGVAGDFEVDIVGHELVRVGGVPVEEALDRLAPLIPRDNRVGVRLVGPIYLSRPRVLHAVGLSDDPAAASYVFSDATGDEVELRCAELGPETPAVFRVAYAPGASGAPLAERLRARAYAFERIGDGALLQYNSCRNEPDESFSSFCKRVFADLDREPPGRLVVDLRGNMGGNSSVTRPLFRELRRRPDLSGKDRLCVLIGPATFSSGMWAAVDLARDFGALLLGEPTSATPNAPGQRGVIVLPNSTLDCGVARRLWNRGGDAYAGPALEPDVRVTESSAQHFAGRDPALEAALGELGWPLPAR